MGSALNALIIGFGFMGEAHYNNLAILERDGKVRVAGVVDIDPSKLTNKKLQSAAIECFNSVQEAYEKERYFDIVVVVTNTVSHEEVIKELFACAVNKKNPPALFVEKPLVENTSQAISTVQNLEAIGYGTALPFTCGYLFRESPALDLAIKYIQEQGLKIQHVRTVWQKLRDTNRPTAGVGRDEATHGLDVVLNYLFPALGLSTKNVALTVSKREYSISICNPELQAKFYGEDHVPLAAVDYTLSVDGIMIEGHSSFMEAPQRREIWLTCDKDVELRVAFDDKKTDHFTVFVEKKQQSLEECKDPNKLLLEWQTFLQSFQMDQGTVKGLEHPPKIPTLRDTLKDIQITDALETVPLNQAVAPLK